jgi:hypothetical protein
MHTDNGNMKLIVAANSIIASDLYLLVIGILGYLLQ